MLCIFLSLWWADFLRFFLCSILLQKQHFSFIVILFYFLSLISALGMYFFFFFFPLVPRPGTLNSVSWKESAELNQEECIFYTSLFSTFGRFTFFCSRSWTDRNSFYSCGFPVSSTFFFFLNSVLPSECHLELVFEFLKVTQGVYFYWNIVHTASKPSSLAVKISGPTHS